VTALHQARGDVAVLVVAAGLGLRLGPGAPKALRPVGGQPLLVHAVRRAQAAPSVGAVVVAAPTLEVAGVRQLVGPGVTVVAGGPSRQSSVGAALSAVPEGYPIVLVHDAARALAPPDLIEAVAAAVRAGHDAVIPVVPVVDTIKQVAESGAVVATVDRSALRAVQTPQGFRRAVLAAAYDALPAGAELTDDAAVVRAAGVPVGTVDGDERAAKVTVPHDLALAELSARTTGERASQGAPATEERNESGVEQ